MMKSKKEWRKEIQETVDGLPPIEIDQIEQSELQPTLKIFKSAAEKFQTALDHLEDASANLSESRDQTIRQADIWQERAETARSSRNQDLTEQSLARLSSHVGAAKQINNEIDRLKLEIDQSKRKLEKIKTAILKIEERLV